ncbi:MAG: DUF502 domain-containing protein [Nitrospinota bacterium]|nr:DUF502 domain-containing protein [Nitrospinota bacterium]MDH5678426.1 DUF502 domain-containing protein [Nitrospinota bacterium]MDH5755988.1 DUF502 domain-containing protein [Nitrospinota bacterium]
MKRVTHSIRRTFLAGLAVVIPIVVTILIFKLMFQTLDNFLGPLVTKALLLAGAPIPKTFEVPGLGIVSTILIVFMVGAVTKNYFGRKLLDLSEWMVDQIPIIRSVYTGAKQVMSAISTAGAQSFSKVVLIEFPRKGAFSLAFITGENFSEVQQRTKEDLVNVFLPTTPNPTTGYFMMIPRQDVIELDMSVEEGIKMLVSAGLVTPKFNPPEEGYKKVKAIRDPQETLEESAEYKAAPKPDN